MISHDKRNDTASTENLGARSGIICKRYWSTVQEKWSRNDDAVINYLMTEQI